MRSFFDPALAVESLPFVLLGLRYTVLIAVASMTAGMVLGLPIALARMSQRRVLQSAARLYISFMRGTPVLVLLFLFYFGLPSVGIGLTAVAAAVSAFGLNSAAFIAEIDRGAILSVSKGQWESARSLGMSEAQILFKVVLPQAARVAVPSLSNVMLDLIKATSLASVITVQEVLLNAKIVAGRTFDTFTMYLTAALVYWAVCSLFSLFQDRLERRLDVAMAAPGGRRPAARRPAAAE
ncbi:MAG: amino acid ABC transporter permease [Spirochaetaceae bacterium]